MKIISLILRSLPLPKPQHNQSYKSHAFGTSAPKALTVRSSDKAWPVTCGAEVLKVQGLGFRVEGLSFRVEDLEFRVESSGLRDCYGRFVDQSYLCSS